METQATSDLQEPFSSLFKVPNAFGKIVALFKWASSSSSSLSKQLIHETHLPFLIRLFECHFFLKPDFHDFQTCRVLTVMDAESLKRVYSSGNDPLSRL